MEKLFSNSGAATDFQALRESLFYSKRTLKALRDYELALKKEKYDDIISPYLSEGGYLPTIIELTKKLNHADLPLEEQEKTFQALLLLCSEPELFFSKTAGCENSVNSLIHNVKSFEKSLKDFEKRWSTFACEFQVCCQYIRRGITDLDREPTGESRLDTKKRNQLKNALNYVYKAYFYELQEYGVKKARIPVVDDRLLTHCYNKQWLLPLAHVILIRDAQLQMMGKVKYKKAGLLDDSLPAFKPGNFPSNENLYIWNMITYKYAGRIQDELIRALSGTCKFEYEADMTKFIQKAYEDYVSMLDKRREAWQEENSKMSRLYLSSISFAYNVLLDERDMRIHKIKKSAPAFFCIPVCHLDEFAIRIATKLHLDTQQLDILIKTLPKFVWDSISFESWRKDKPVFDNLSESALSDLNQLLSALKSLLNPREYFSGKNADTSSCQLRNAAKILDNASGAQRTGDDADLLWRVFKKTIYFQDLTCLALLSSGAVSTQYCPEEILPDIVASYMEDLSCYLYEYQEKNFIKERFGIQKSSNKNDLSPKTKYVKMYLKKQPFYEELMQKVEEQTIGAGSINSIEDLDLDMAEKFWMNSKFSPARQTATCVAELLGPVKNTMPEIHQRAIKNLSSEQEAIICFQAYSQVIRKFAAVIESSVQDTLLGKAIQFARTSMGENTVNGGKSL